MGRRPGLGHALSLHTGTRRWRPGADGADPTLVDIVERTNKEHDVRIALAAMIFGGVFERYPRLKVGAVEFEVAWVPYFLARMDNLYTEQALGVHGRRFKDGASPSDFFRQNCFVSFQEDAVGIQLRDLMGVETLLWGRTTRMPSPPFPGRAPLWTASCRGCRRWSRPRSRVAIPPGCIISARTAGGAPRRARRPRRLGGQKGAHHVCVPPLSDGCRGHGCCPASWCSPCSPPSVR